MFVFVELRGFLLLFKMDMVMGNYGGFSLSYLLRSVSSCGIHYSLVESGNFDLLDLLLCEGLVMELLGSGGTVSGGILMDVLCRLGELGYEVVYIDGDVLGFCVNVDDDRFRGGELLGSIRLMKI